MVMMMRCARPPAPRFRADRPFLYALLDSQTMGIMLCSAMIGEPPVPRFDADRPFLTVILVDDTPYFMATQRGDF
ncbi:hypothetical protein RR46_10547 [Papilio xuthus]|uniref:Uncharacterized protein n=1 Tax=Papilio xuthus TaxID=66420 RepID=A0A194PIZ0_PAPXU|nr:hypothetical protein RR46_10547 [Papilio xuthus]